MAQYGSVDPSQNELTQRRVDRRRFLTTFALGAGLAPLATLSGSLSARRIASACFAGKRVLNAGDFSYLGAMRVPPDLSSFSYAALAARRVNGQLRFFMAGENSSNAITNSGCLDCVWEFADTQSYNPNYALAPRATVLTKWGDVYQGRRRSWIDGQSFEMQYLITAGLFYKNDRLYWSFADSYNVGGRQDWCLGMTQLNGSPANMQAFGPWRPDIGVRHAAGWIVEMPDGSMGVGMGLSSGNIGSSWGPELTAGCPFPTPSTPGGYGAPDLVFPQKHVRYGWAGMVIDPSGMLVPGQTLPSLARPGNYVWHNPRTTPDSQAQINELNPLVNGGVGSFTQTDCVNSCVYIDLPEKHGILFPGSLGTEHVWYGFVHDCGHGFGNPCGGGQGPNASSREPRWWIYDPDQCLRVATGHLAPNLTPASQFNPEDLHPLQLGCDRKFGGSYFDRDTRRLYVAAYQADVSIPGMFLPLLHVYQIS